MTPRRVAAELASERVPVGLGGPPPATTPPLMVHAAVASPDEHIESVRAPGDCRWHIFDLPTQCVPCQGRRLPGLAIPPLVEHLPVPTTGEEIKPVRAPRDHGGRAYDRATEEDRKSTRHFRPAATARLCRQPLLARGAGSAPSTRRQHAAAAHSKAWRGLRAVWTGGARWVRVEHQGFPGARASGRPVGEKREGAARPRRAGSGSRVVCTAEARARGRAYRQERSDMAGV